MINAFVLRKHMALILVGTIPAIAIIFIMTFAKQLILMVPGMPFWVWFLIPLLLYGIFHLLAANVFLTDPFRKMVEGQGQMLMTMDSPGIFRFFNFSKVAPFFEGKVDDFEINEKFNRQTINYMVPPVEVNEIVKQDEQGNLHFTIPYDTFVKSKFSLNNYGVVVYNSVLKQLVTKDKLYETENNAFGEKVLVNMDSHVLNLERTIRDFNRVLGEQFKPTGTGALAQLFKSPWFWVILLLLIGVIGYMMFPKILAAGQGIQNSVTNAAGGITIRG